MGEKHDYDTEKEVNNLEKAHADESLHLEEAEPENSKIEAVRLGMSLKKQKQVVRHHFVQNSLSSTHPLILSMSDYCFSHLPLSQLSP